MADSFPRALGGHPTKPGASLRTDQWRTEPVLVVFGFLVFVVYTTWAALQGNYYYADPYLSPFYAPLLFVKPDVPGGAPVSHAWFGTWPSWWPAFLPASPAIFILIFPGAFRFTCYYYRKAYYRSFAASPPACGVVPGAKIWGLYRGETRFLIFQNLHRFALYFALLFVPLLYIEAFSAFFKDGRFGFGVGTIMLLVNATLIASYTLGCHSLRHLVGGGQDCMSCGKATVRYGLWKWVSRLNARHMKWAWLSLIFIMFTDLYIRLVSMGVIHDLNTWR
jgi:hypothetical protein